MAIRPAGSQSQKLTWRTAPTLQHVTGTQRDFELRDYVNYPNLDTATIFFSLASGYTYPAGWSQQNSTGRVRMAAGAVPVRKDLKWSATPQGKSSVASPLGWVETLPAVVLTPTVPQNVVAEPTGTTSVSVSWSAGAAGGSTVTAYRVYQGPSNTGPWTEAGSVSAATFTHPVTGLEADTPYWFTVDAYDGTAASVKAPPDDARTFRGAPDAPVSFGASGTGPNTITVTWVAASTQPPAVEFRLYSSSSAGGTYIQVNGDLTGSSYPHTGLDPSTEYFYKLKAVDASNTESAFTPVFSAFTQAPALPAAPTDFTATPRSDTVIDLAWQPGTGGSAPASYTVYKSNTGAPGTFTVASVGGVPASGITDLFYAHTSITPGKQNWYQVAAVNAAGSAVSVTQTATTYLYEIPIAPLNVAVTPDANNPTTALRVTWTPASGGPVPEHYQVHHATSSGGPYTPEGTEPTGTSYVDSGLNPGSTHYYKIKAVDIVNAVETESAFSPVGTGTTQALAMVGTPVIDSVTGTGLATMQVIWHATGTATPTGYKVERATPTSSSPWNTVAANHQSLTFNDSGLASNTQYWYRVSALDTTADPDYTSNASAAKSGTTNALAPDATPPAPVPVIEATATGSTTASVSWTSSNDPTVAGEERSGLKGYRIYRNGPAVHTTTGTGTTWPDSNLQPATAYTYEVAALDVALNESAKSNAVTVTTSGAGSGWPVQTPTYTAIIPGEAGPGLQTVAGTGRTLNTVHADGALVNAVTVYQVSNLNTSGSGSLAAAISSHNGGSGHSLIVFGVCGRIAGGSYNITRPNLRIAGQTAPGKGILISGSPFQISTSDVVVEHIRVQRATDGENDCITILGATNGATPASPHTRIVLDHLTSIWFGDGAIDGHWAIGEVSLLHCIIGEGIRNPNDVGGHRFLTVVFGESSLSNVLYKGCLFHKGVARNPMSRSVKLTVCNSVMYVGWNGPTSGNNAEGTLISAQNELLAAQAVDIIGNTYKRMPATGWRSTNCVSIEGACHTGTRVYLSDNSKDGSTPSNQWTLVGNDTSTSRQATSPVNQASANPKMAGVQLVPRATAYSLVLDTVGCRPGDRDACATRIVNEVTNNTGTQYWVAPSGNTPPDMWPNLGTATVDHTSGGNPYPTGTAARTVQADHRTALEAWVNAFKTAVE